MSLSVNNRSVKTNEVQTTVFIAISLPPTFVLHPTKVRHQGVGMGQGGAKFSRVLNVIVGDTGTYTGPDFVKAL